MNKRIQELWDKAEHSVNEVFVWDPTGPDREDVIREKFAELIVRECASVIEKNHPEFTCKEDADNLYRKAGRMDAIDEILQHFGVE